MRIQDKAFLVAQSAHSTQMYDIFPYIYHIQCVWDIAIELQQDEVIQTACILHDVLEDSGLTFNDIKKEFGWEVAEIVYAVTDEMGRNRIERKAKTYPKIAENWKAVIVKICDRIANIEHSHKSGSSMLKKYKDEHKGFVEALSNKEHTNPLISIAWSRLNQLVASI